MPIAEIWLNLEPALLLVIVKPRITKLTRQSVLIARSGSLFVSLYNSFTANHRVSFHNRQVHEREKYRFRLPGST